MVLIVFQRIDKLSNSIFVVFYSQLSFLNERSK